MKNIKNIRIAIVSSSFRGEIAASLTKHCVSTLKQKGLSAQQIEIFNVPGALEIPIVAKKLAKKEVYDAIITFGAVLKGDTYHFEQVSDECVRGCMNVAYEFEVPVVFQVLCVYDLKDALDRATGSEDNRGVEGALTALKMIEVIAGL